MPDGPGDWGGAAKFMLSWALYFYSVGNDAAGDRHLAVALNNVREAHRAAERLRG